MKKSYLLLLMLFVSIVAMGGPVTPDEARQKIAKFMSPRRAGAVSESALKLVATSHYLAQEDVMAASYYVFNVGESQGYVIAAADDRVPAVLGYSDKGKFDPQNMPDNMKAWLQSYDDQMKYLSEHPEAAAPQKTVTGSSINPMLETEWNQGYPYNMFCPMDGSKQCVTGCVATAMAQVMYFWKYPKQTAAEIPGYTSSTKKIEMPAIAAGTSIDWDNMLPKYNGSESDTQQEAVAELMLLCGTAVQMDYTASSSGAASLRVADAWLDWLDYDAATKYENRSKYRLAAWNQKVYDELKVGRPVLYSGQSSGGGHAFVIDGYGGDDYFHVNWGWGGGSNNYFLLSILDPGSSAGIGASSSTDGYSFEQGAIFGAQPNTGQSPVVKVVMTTTQVRSDLGSEFTRSATTEDFSVDVSFNCWNWTGDTHSFDLGCGVFNTDDQLVAAFADYYNPHNFEPNYGFNSKTVKVSFGANVTSGSYFLKPISRETGTDTWYANDRTDVNFLTASISDNTVMVSVPPEPVFGLTGSIAAAGKQEVGAPLSLTASITNNGTLYNGEIFLVVDDKMVGGRHFDLDAGASDDVVFTYTPTTEGTNNIDICTREYSGGGYQYTPFITGSVTVAAAATANLSMYPTTKNAVYEDGKTYVKSDKVVINIEITNNGDTDYDNDVIVKLYRIVNGNSGTSAGKASKTIQLPAGGFTEVDLELGGLEDGETYFYYVYYKSAGQEVQGYQWSPMFTVKIEGEEPQVEKFTVQGIDVAGTQKTNEDLTITVNVKNEGNVQTGKLYLFVNNTLQKTFDVDITAGETKAYEATYKPTQAGDITIKVTTDEAGETLAGTEAAATKTVTITDPEVVKFTVQGIDVAGTQKTNEDLTLTVNVKNEGNVQTGKLYLFVNNTLQKTFDVDITAGETKAYEATYKPTQAGDITIKVTTDEAGETLAGTEAAATKTVTITDPEVVKFTVQGIDVAGTQKTNEDLTITVSVKNEGNVQTGKLYLFVNNTLQKTFDVDITAGETKAYEATYKPTQAGDITIKVTTDEAGETLAGAEEAATKTVTITDPEVVKFTVQGIDVAGTQKTNEDLTITVSVKNEGNVQTGKLYLFVNNTLQKTFDVDITAGETKAYETTYKPTQAGDITIKVTTDEAGETLAGAEGAATKTVTITDPVKTDPELAIQANEHFDSELGYFTGKLDQPFNSPELVNPHDVSPIEWTSSNPSVATVDENGVVTLLSIGGTKIKAAFAGNDEYNPGYTEYWLEVADVVGYVIEEDGTVTVVGGDDVTGDVEISGTVEIDGQAYQVTGIGENAFQDNTGITSVTIPDGITTIGANAFEGCSNLMTISIGKGVTNIGEKAFANIGTPSNALKRAEGEGLLVKCYAESVPTTAADAFEGSPISSGTLLVEDNSVMDYYAATPWGQFGTVMGFNGTTSIELLVNDMGGGPVSVFSLNGNKLAETQGAGLKQVLNTLPKGVYIVNGRKIVVK